MNYSMFRPQIVVYNLQRIEKFATMFFMKLSFEKMSGKIKKLSI